MKIKDSSNEKNKYLVYFENISKYYGNIVANDNITLGILPGTIHGILGENGAGKSTLINILCGKIKPSAGSVFVNGKEINFKNPKQAQRSGIEVVHQNLSLLQSLTVWENIALSDKGIKGLIHPKRFCDELKLEALKYGIIIDPSIPVWKLSMGERQQVEIFKTLRHEYGILICLDEPTSLLTPNESLSLLKKLRVYIKYGKTIIFISHKLHEIEHIVDYVTILRNGRVIETSLISNTTRSNLINNMFGETVSSEIKRSKYYTIDNTPKVELKSVTVKSTSLKTGLNNINFKIYGGEILGVAGISGNGQKALAEIINGLIKLYKGEILFNNNQQHNNLRTLYIPEDIQEEAIAENFSVFENLFLHGITDQKFKYGPFILWNKVIKEALEIIKKYNINPENPFMKVKKLSGGNIQKLVVARETNELKNSLLIAHNPTKGLDFKTSKEIHRLMMNICNQGSSILLISEDLDEIFDLSNRIIVLNKGEITFMGETNKLSKTEVGRKMVTTEIAFS